MPRACGRWRGVADYLTVNISSPNTPGLRALQDKGALDALLAAVVEARGAGPPLFLKVAPDLEPGEIDAIARGRDRREDRRADRRQHHDQPAAARVAASRRGRRPFRRAAEGAGARSGCAISAAATGGALPLIAAGGIENGVDAFDRIRAGASLVQLYTALVYRGPGLARGNRRRAAGACSPARLRALDGGGRD